MLVFLSFTSFSPKWLLTEWTSEKSLSPFGMATAAEGWRRIVGKHETLVPCNSSVFMSNVGDKTIELWLWGLVIADYYYIVLIGEVARSEMLHLVWSLNKGHKRILTIVTPSRPNNACQIKACMFTTPTPRQLSFFFIFFLLVSFLFPLSFHILRRFTTLGWVHHGVFANFCNNPMKHWLHPMESSIVVGEFELKYQIKPTPISFG